MVNNGNRTNRSAINAKIIRVVTKSIDRVAGGQKKKYDLLNFNIIIRFFHDDTW